MGQKQNSLKPILFNAAGLDSKPNKVQQWLNFKLVETQCNYRAGAD